MASAVELSRPLEIRGGKDLLETSKSPSPEKCKSYLDLGITLALFLWPSLTLAVNSNWGGPETPAKREWFASATIDLIAENPDADAEWIEEFLLNVMFDEFEVNVEDDSALDVAETIVRLRNNCAKGNWTEIIYMKNKWDFKDREKKNMPSNFIRGEDQEAETSGSDQEDDENEEKSSVETDKDTKIRSVKIQEPLEIDEDGFTKVTRKKR